MNSPACFILPQEPLVGVTHLLRAFRLYLTYILVGNYDLYDFRNLSGQAARRGRDLHFPRYRLDSQVECEEFVGALRYLLERVPLLCELDDLLSHWRWFAEWSIGCVGTLRDWVVETVAALCEEGGTTLTIKALEQYALQPDQRVRMEIEARAGEHKVEVGKARSQQQLLELIGNAAKTPQTTFNQNGSAASQAATVPTPGCSDTLPPKTPKGSKVERAPQRDRVGEGMQEGTTTRCLFSGSIIDVPASNMKDAGVLRVECPECLTMRGLTPQGETARFPPHDQRKTRTPHREARWIRREGVWELAGESSAT